MWSRQGEVCNHCERAIPIDLMHGDHIVPWSQGGRTELSNCQALCPSCNLRKGSKPDVDARERFEVPHLNPGTAELRKWQGEAMTVIEGEILRRPVLVEACPGAGKTLFGLTLAYRLMALGEIARLLIVVPTRSIADGWAAAASVRDSVAPTIPLRTSADWRAIDPIDLGALRGDTPSWMGAVLTYQSLALMPDMYLAHATEPGHRTLVIFDEVHHAGSENSWGAAAQEAFSSAVTAVLSLSGTPFRTEGDPIAFVQYTDGKAEPDYRYGYDQAIVDEACRPIQFATATGTATFENEHGELESVTFDDEDLTDSGVRRRLRAAIEWVQPDSIAHRLLDDANKYLLTLRRAGDTDAAGLVVCVDCDHADQVASYMASAFLKGRRPTVACSVHFDNNDPDPANAIRRFRTAQTPWLLAVNMVSEGVDIKRLRTVVYLTNRLTELSFRQIVGRVVRTDVNNEDDHGRVYIPGDPRLIEMALSIQREVGSLKPPIEIDLDTPVRAAPQLRGELGENPTWTTVGTDGEKGSAFDTNQRFADSALIEAAQAFIDAEGLTGTSAESLALLASENDGLRSKLDGYMPRSQG